MRKRLSHHAEAVLARALNTDQVRRVTHTVRPIGALLRLDLRLDANYDPVKAAA